MTNVRRIIRSIKNLFGADVRLRKWCVKIVSGVEKTRTPDYQMRVAQNAAELHAWITGRISDRELFEIKYRDRILFGPKPGPEDMEGIRRAFEYLFNEHPR